MELISTQEESVGQKHKQHEVHFGKQHHIYIEIS